MLMGNRIAEARGRRGWNKAELARRARVAPSYVTRIEQGRFDRPSADLLGRLADALGVRVADLTGTATAPPGESDLLAQLRLLTSSDPAAMRAILDTTAGLSPDEQASALRFMRDMLIGARALASAAATAAN